jgi:uncharacterized protein with PIN domain
VRALQHFFLAGIILSVLVEARANIPFSRCRTCNALLQNLEKNVVIDSLEPLTKIYYSDFWRCTGCGQVYWAGSHFEKLPERIDEIRHRLAK